MLDAHAGVGITAVHGQKQDKAQRTLVNAPAFLMVKGDGGQFAVFFENALQFQHTAAAEGAKRGNFWPKMRKNLSDSDFSLAQVFFCIRGDADHSTSASFCASCAARWAESLFCHWMILVEIYAGLCSSLSAQERTITRRPLSSFWNLMRTVKRP